MNAKMRLIIVFVMVFSVLMGFSGGHTVVKAAAADNVLFTGRFDFSDPNKVVFSHVGNSIKANFNGTGISVTLSSLSKGQSAASYFYVIVDGNVTPGNRTLISVSSSKLTTIQLASGLPAGNHSIELVKETEYDTEVAFYGFTVTGGALLSPPSPPALKLEFYGDSNPAGWSAYDPTDAGVASLNGGYYIYPSITCRMLNAECSNISMGGVGITDKAWRNLADYYHLINMEDPSSGSNLWDFNNYTPDAVVINASSNDYYSGATKEEIKDGWKNFVGLIRGHYPGTHIVIAESYGWAYNEPTDYIAETVSEIHATGDVNVSFVKFPWLWGQEHAVINEHAGFANILASHLANELGLSQPTPSTLSSFAPYGTVTNGGFEKTTIPGYADGWRPHGAVTLIENAAQARTGDNTLEVYNQAWVNFAGPATPGTEFTVTGWMRGAKNGDLGKLKLEFKDQGQNTLGTNEGLVSLSTGWQQFSTTSVAPPGTWSVWVVLVAEFRDRVYFDDIQMTWE